MSDEESPVLKGVLVFPRPTLLKKCKFSEVRDVDPCALLADEPIRVQLDDSIELDAIVLWPGIDKALPTEVDIVIYHVRHEDDEKVVRGFIDHYSYVVHKHVMRTHGSDHVKLAVELDATFKKSLLETALKGKEKSITTAFNRIFEILDVDQSGAIELEDIGNAAEKFGLAFSEEDQVATLKAFGDEEQLRLEDLIKAWRYNTLPAPFSELFNRILKNKKTLRGFSDRFKAVIDRSLPVISQGTFDRNVQVNIGPKDFKAGVTLSIEAGYNRPDIVSNIADLFEMLPESSEAFFTLKFPIKHSNHGKIETFYHQLLRFLNLFAASIYYDSDRIRFSKFLMAERFSYKILDGHFYLNIGTDSNAFLGGIRSSNEMRTTKSFLKALSLLTTPQTLINSTFKLSTDLNAHLDDPNHSLIPTSIFATLKSNVSRAYLNLFGAFQSNL